MRPLFCFFYSGTGMRGTGVSHGHTGQLTGVGGVIEPDRKEASSIRPCELLLMPPLQSGNNGLA